MDINNLEEKETAALLYEATTRLLEYSREKIFVKDKNLVYRGASDKFVKMAGWESAQDIIGKTDFDIFEDQDLAEHYRYDDLELMKTRRNLIDYIEPIADINGHSRYASTTKLVLTDKEGQVLGIAGISRDITNEYYLKRHSNPALQYLFDLPEKAYCAVYMDLDEWRVVNAHRRVIDGVEVKSVFQMESLIPRAYAGIVDRRWPAASFYHDFSREALEGLYEAEKRKILMEYRRTFEGETIRWVRDEIHLLRDNVNGHLCMVLVVWDVQDAKMEEEERIRLAERDELTNLLNRKETMRLIRERLQNSLEDEKHALLMIDADYFKSVNDTYGHQAGDTALKELAQEIGGSFRTSDIVGRIGGDEFFVLMTHVPDRSTVEMKTEKLLERIRQVHYGEIYLSASIGVSIFPDDAKTMEKMYSQADKAMYTAKQTRGNIVFAQDLPAEKQNEE